MNRPGYLLLLLHAHLPYVRHPEQERCSEERWLFEAITDCYLPLLDVFEGLARRGIPYRITLSLSPTLVAMFGDDLLRERYQAQLRDLIDLTRREEIRLNRSPAMQALAIGYRKRFESSLENYRGRYDCDLSAAFGRLAEAGHLELITTAATHGYLPLLRTVPSAVRAQLQVAAGQHRAVFGRPASCAWLPECGYYPALEPELYQAGFNGFFLESHGVVNARPRPTHGVQTPLALPSGLAAFGRDPECSSEVWSRERGFPGHPLYREYHRDIGDELSDEQLGPLAGGPTGIKYHRITDRAGGEKACYEPEQASRQARLHARAFIDRRRQAAGVSDLRDRPPLFVAPFDAELFGHWWYEGPQWLATVIEQAASGDGVELIGPSEYLERHPVLPRAEPSPSSWGEGGYNRVWLNESNAWLLPQLHGAARRMGELANANRDGTLSIDKERGLNQAARSLLLAQSSDWPFIMRTGTTVEYAAKRVADQLARFRYLVDSLDQGEPDPRRLAALEQMDAIFPDMDFRVYAEAR